MTKKSIITASQLFVTLFVSRMTINITYNSYLTPGGELQDYIMSAGLAFILNFLMIIPVWLLYRHNQGLNIMDYGEDLFGKFGKIIAVFYGLYVLWICIYNFAYYNNFVSNVMAPKISIVIVSLAVVITSCYGAIKGIEGLVRVSSLIFILIAASIIFIVCASATQVKEYNFKPFFYDGYDDFAGGLRFMLMNSSSIAIMAILLPFAKGNVRRSVLLWNIGVYVVLAALLTVIVGALGDFVKTQTFPVYVLSSMAQMGILKRMDSIYIAIWTSGLFVKLSLYLYCFSLCVQRLFGGKSGKFAIITGGVAAGITAIFMSGNEQLSSLTGAANWMLTATLAVTMVIPLIIWIIAKLRFKGEARK